MKTERYVVEIKNNRGEFCGYFYESTLDKAIAKCKQIPNLDRRIVRMIETKEVIEEHEGLQP